MPISSAATRSWHTQRVARPQRVHSSASDATPTSTAAMARMVSDCTGSDTPAISTAPRGISCGKLITSGPQIPWAMELMTSPAPSALIIGTVRGAVRTGR
jgi:hypothetical protein